eukprot:586309_1
MHDSRHFNSSIDDANMLNSHINHHPTSSIHDNVPNSHIYHHPTSSIHDNVPNSHINHRSNSSIHDGYKMNNSHINDHLTNSIHDGFKMNNSHSNHRSNSLIDDGYKMNNSWPRCLCFIMVSLLVVSVVVGVSSQNRLLSASITVYQGSGILVKDFPGDTARVIQIAADNSVMPQLQQCARGDLSYQNDFFLSKEEFNDSSDALKFDELQANAASGKIGLWVCQPAFGNKVEFLSYPAAYIPRPILTVSRLVNQSDKLTLTNIPHHIGPVSLIATGPSGDILVTLTP